VIGGGGTQGIVYLECANQQETSNNNPDAPDGPTMPTPPFVFGAKSLNCLKAAADLVRYYETVGRDLTAGNMRWDPIIKLFNNHWKSLTERKKEDRPETPKITRGLPVVKWDRGIP
jgi:hypothetical protein